VALSHVQDCYNIRLYVKEEQLMSLDESCTRHMPTVNNIVYQDVLSLNHGNYETDDNSLEDLI
jgi:hypothetical protein